MKFELGQVVVTRGVSDATEESRDFKSEVMLYLARHSLGNWGVVCDEDKQINDDAVRNGKRILSAYETCKGKIWIITEADRSVTTVLFPHEY